MAENVAASSNDQGKFKFQATSAYDAITEVISHGIKNFQHLDEFFKSKVGKKENFTSYKFCYPTALLNYAKTGSCEEAYKVRSDILNEIHEEMTDFEDKSSFSKVNELLDLLNMSYPFIFKRKYCFNCKCLISYNLRSLNLFDLSRNTCIWKNYKILQPMLDRYFARKTKQCSRCRENYDSYYVNPGPLLCINVETMYECLYKNSGYGVTNSEIFLRCTCSKMMHSSLDMLPRRLTVECSTYVLYGMIERCKDKVNEEVYYVAYCRNLDDTWERRDGFEGEKKLLTDLSIDTIALVFYADIGQWDKSQRKLLLKPARLAWYKLTNVELPELCLEKIFSFLDNWGLKALMRSVEEEIVSEVERNDVSVFSFRSDSPEYKEQDRRSRNILLHNLPIGDDISDVDRARSLLISLSRYMDLDNIHVRRYREKMMNEEFPITVVTFQTQVEADLCIRLRRRLLSKGIKIEGDYTNWQKRQLEKLMDIAKRHNQANPDDRKAAFIKSGVPVLVKKRNRHRVKAESSKANVEDSEVSVSRADVAE